VNQLTGRLYSDLDNLSVRFSWDPERLRVGRVASEWETVRIPRRRSVPEFQGVPLRTVDFELLLDGYYREPGQITSVASDRQTLERMAAPVGGRDSGNKPHLVRIVRVRPWWVGRVRWLIRDLVELDEDFIVVPGSGIVRCRYAIELLEFREEELLRLPVQEVRRESDAESEKKSQPKIHTVVAGDTLWALADRYLGSGTRWKEIADKNGVRDPRRLQIGTELKIPAS